MVFFEFKNAFAIFFERWMVFGALLHVVSLSMAEIRKFLALFGR